MTTINIDKASTIISTLQDTNAVYVESWCAYIDGKRYTVKDLSDALILAVNMLNSSQGAFDELQGAIVRKHPEYDGLGWEDIILTMNEEAGE